MNPEPLIDWGHVLQEVVLFASVFLAAGAVGFRWSALRAVEAGGGTTGERSLTATIATRTAITGLAGALLALGLFAFRLPESARRRGLTALELLVTSAPAALQLAVLAVTFTGFVLALCRVRAGWWIAAAGVLVNALRQGLLGHWDRVVNPVHLLAAGTWIGTLGVLVVTGMPAVLRSGLEPGRRGALAARMVHAFSPLALGAAMVLVGFGIITAVQHVRWPAALWTTPYGTTFLVKLGVVAVVFALGAFHWLGVRPRLGAEDEAARLWRSARTELLVAMLVLAITAVLVSLPTPRLPGT